MQSENRIPSQSGSDDDWQRWAEQQAAEINRGDDGREEAGRENSHN
ncbi:MAG: hypothetical protein SH850_07980 [Planctomycetaceae bacterium]|nr:hypothetical protein [Planctomycetaceae bacterium]